MLSEQEQIRLEKLKKISVKNPDSYKLTHELEEARELPDGTNDVSVAGRIIAVRNLGKLSFVKISNVFAGFQLVLRHDTLGEERYNFFHEVFDIGDFIGAEGEVFTTRAGEKSLRVTEYKFLGKAYRPLPEKFHGLTDKEEIYRKRYLDLIANQESAAKLILRTKIIKNIRNFLHDNGYTEVETPILCNKASGALARPFITHHNAYNMDVFLRISPETYLKRAVIGGFNKVFEIARDFRNEGNDPRHVQDFTMVEGYAAYQNCEYNMGFCHDMVAYVVQQALGTTEVEIFGEKYDLAKPWKVVTFRELVLGDCGIDIEKFKDPKKLIAEIDKRNIKLDFDGDVNKIGYGTLVDQLYKKVSRPKIKEPTYLTQHPIELSPLARANDANPNVVDRFQLIINGTELINGYSELVDAKEQRERLDAQARLRNSGDTEAMMSDDDYVESMEYGMPPISGWGWGMDTFIGVLTSSLNIRDIIMFPLLKPEK